MLSSFLRALVSRCISGESSRFDGIKAFRTLEYPLDMPFTKLSLKRENFEGLSDNEMVDGDCLKLEA